MRYLASAVLLGVMAIALPAHAQTQSTVTVGTTTYDISVPAVRTFDDVQRELDDILYYLRTFDSQTYVPPQSSRTHQSSFITDLVFSSDESSAQSAAEPTTSARGADTASDQACPVFTTDLSLGVSHPQVRALQELLNSSPQTRVAAEGVGSPGNETEYFGNRTLNAVRAFQTQYAADVLAPVGLTAPTGYWGASSRAFANTLSGCGE